MKLAKMFSVVIVISILFPFNAHAKGYFSGSFGISKSQESGFEDDKGFKIGGGYKLNDNFAIEVAYVDLGEFEADDESVSTLEFISGYSIDKAYVEIDGFEFNVLASAPVSGNAAVFAKLGFFIWDAAAKVDFTSFGNQTVSDDDGNDLLFGIGFMVGVSKKVAFKCEYTRYDAFDGDSDLLSAGINLSF